MEASPSPRCSNTRSHHRQSMQQFLKAKSGRVQRPGPIGRNPYLNFLREFRKQNCGLSAVEIIRRGAQEWRSLPKDRKLQFIEAAFYAPKKFAEPVDGCCPKVSCPKKRSRSKCKRRKPKKRRCAKRKVKRGCKRKRRRPKCPRRRRKRTC